MANDGKTIIPTPTWVLVVRILQIIISLIVIGISGWFIHGLYLSSLGFAIVCVSDEDVPFPLFCLASS